MRECVCFLVVIVFVLRLSSPFVSFRLLSSPFVAYLLPAPRFDFRDGVGGMATRRSQNNTTPRAQRGNDGLTDVVGSLLFDRLLQ